MKGRIFLSLFCGIVFGSIAYLVVSLFFSEYAFLYALVGGALFTLFLNVFLTIHEKWTDKRYSAIEKEIKSPIFYTANGNFDLGTEVRNGRIYFCEEGIVCVSLDKKPHACDVIPLSDIDRYEFDSIHMNLYLKDGRAFCIILPDANVVLEELKNKNWIQS